MPLDKRVLHLQFNPLRGRARANHGFNQGMGWAQVPRWFRRDCGVRNSDAGTHSPERGPILHRVFLNSGWYDAGQLDGRLSQAIRFDHGLALHFGQETKLTIAACVRLRSYVDAFANRGLPVELRDLANWGLGGYLDRIGVLEDLGSQVSIVDLTPAGLAQARRGQNDSLEEVVRVPATGPMDRGVAERLASKLAACAVPEVQDALANTAYTCFAELIGNIRTHSGSPTPGFAALQVYTPRVGSQRIVEVVVADAGLGILDTLRPALQAKQLLQGELDDQALLLHAVNSGISRHGEGAGCGITQSAKRLLRLPGPQLELRLPTTRLRFEPGPAGGYVITQARTGHSVSPLPGTHWTFRYSLDYDPTF